MAVVDTVEAPKALHGRRLGLIFAGLMLVMLMAALDSTIVATALPTIAGDLGGLNHISWVTTAYLLAQTVVTPLYGKLGDQFGRRIVLQVGLVIFLVGSALCGLSTSFPELIVFRALQGLGGGGLMVSAQAAIGDVVPPRDRGRYQGLFGAVFGVATVIGPLVGGAITSGISWRWIFYINLPIGLVALVVLALTIPAVKIRTRHTIDYLGTALLALALSSLVLAVSLGGTTYAWKSVQIIGMGAVTVVALAIFLWVEQRAAEPVLPPRLLKNEVFITTSIVALLLGFAMFGTITFLPLYFQVVKGSTPTASGLQILPLMAGLLITSIIGGQIVSRTGRYKIFPIIGTAFMTLGLFLLAQLSPTTPSAVAALYMFTAGFGIGLIMQVLVVAVQNAVGYEDLGVATSGTTLMRNIGASVGTAIVGTIFAAELTKKLAHAFPGQTGAAGDAHLTAAQLDRLPPAVHATVVQAYADSLDRAFTIAGIVSIVAFIASWFIKELPMRATVSAEDIGGAFGAPRGAESYAEIYRALSVLAGRQNMQEWLGRIAAESGVGLPLLNCWMLVQLRRDPDIDLPAQGRDRNIPAARFREALDELVDRSLIASNADDAQGLSTAWVLTPAGEEVSDQLLAAVRARLEGMLSGWSPEQYPELVTLLNTFASDIVPSSAPELARSGGGALAR
jgi:EmrB/QacA subfamily drug resistance transporter